MYLQMGSLLVQMPEFPLSCGTMSRNSPVQVMRSSWTSCLHGKLTDSSDSHSELTGEYLFEFNSPLQKLSFVYRREEDKSEPEFWELFCWPWTKTWENVNLLQIKHVKDQLIWKIYDPISCNKLFINETLTFYIQILCLNSCWNSQKTLLCSLLEYSVVYVLHSTAFVL